MATRGGKDKMRDEPVEAREGSLALPADLTRALTFLRAHLSEPVQLDRLADIAGVRPRTLETHFKAFLGTSPLGWVRRARLMRARQQLLSAGPDSSITDVALSSGFSQLGRFSAEYRSSFGELPSATLRRVRQQTDDDVADEALRLTFRALPQAFAVAPQQCEVALEQLERPMELLPSYGLPKAVAGWCWGQRASHRFSATPDADRELSCRLANEAYELAPDDALTVAMSSGSLVLAHRFDEAERRLERALALDPSLAYGWTRRGWMSAYLGDSDSALRELKIALHLMPFDPLKHITFIGIGCAYFNAGNYERAAKWTRDGVEMSPGSFWATRVAIAAAALAGARTEARRMGRQLMRKDPDLTVSEARRAWPFSPAFMTRLGDGLEIAGLPRN